MNKSRVGRNVFSMVLAMAVAVVADAASGQTPSPAEKDGTRPVTAVAGGEGSQILTYPVGDLVLNVPDYPYPGSTNSATLFRGASGVGMAGMGGMGGGMMGGLGGGSEEGGMTGGYGGAGSAPSSDRITIEDLKRVILTVISPDTWVESGGQEGELQHLGTSLVIRQTAAVHQEIEELLDQIRKGSGEQKTVSIDARWLLLNSDELEKLMPPKDEGEPQIVREVLAEFTRRPSSLRGKTNCFTGQLVYLVSGTRRNVVTSFIPVVGSVKSPVERQYAALAGGARVVEAQAMSQERAVGYQPVIATPNLGVLLQIRPTLVPGEDRAIVDLSSTLTVLGESSPDAGESSDREENSLVPNVDRVAIETQELATTLSVPMGEPALAGGLTYIGPSAEVLRGTGEAKEDGAVVEVPQLYLVLEVK